MIDKLEMLIALAQERHFGKAAESLGVAQPTLSTGIKQLEEQLGVQLVFRGSRFRGLTPEGQRALEWARQIVGDARQLKEEMRFTRHGLSGRLRLAAIPTALIWAAHLCSAFNRLHPKVHFTLLSRTSAEILDMLENLDIDGGISYLDNEPVGRVTRVPLYQEDYSLLCATGSALADRTTLDWGELGGQKLCLLTPDMQNRRIINQHLRSAGVTPEVLMESNSTIVLAAQVERSDWVTILPHEMASFLARGKAMRIVPIRSSDAAHGVGLLATYREPHTPVLAALIAQARRMADAAPLSN